MRLPVGQSLCAASAMAAQGATLQNYNNELVKCVDDLKEKREEVNKAILKDVRAPPSPTACHAHRSPRRPRRGDTLPTAVR